MNSPAHEEVPSAVELYLKSYCTYPKVKGGVIVMSPKCTRGDDTF